MGKTADIAESRFTGDGFACSQAVFSAFAEEAGLDLRTALRVASSFGAGMARMGNTCGAVTGALMVLGLRYGREEGGDTAAKERNYRLAREFMKRFRERFGDTVCRDLLGFDPGSDEGRRRFAEEPEVLERCAGYVRGAAEILEDIIEREG